MLPPRREPTGRWIAVLVASVTAHFVVLSILNAVPREAPISRVKAIDVAFRVIERPPSMSADPATASRERPIRAKPMASASEPAETPPTPKLDPASAARAFVLFQRASPSEASEGEGEGLRKTEAEAPNYFEGVGDKRYLSRRAPPSLQRHQDGTYRYRGQAFKAIVEKDGSVVFDDGYRQSATLSFDMTDVIMRRRGEDPYRVEKNWFLEGTAEFREDLFERWSAKQTLLALRKLRRRLLHISEDRTLSAQQKSACVIAMFQDTSDDEAGAAARSAIAEFVMDRMPTTALPHGAR